MHRQQTVITHKNQALRFESCPCCGCSGFQAFYINPKPAEIRSPDEFAYGGSRYMRAIYRCKSCNFRFSNDASIEDSMFYSMDTTTVASKTLPGKNRYFRAVIRMTDTVLGEPGRNKSLLDIGAGSGAFVMQLENLGFDGAIDAVEINDQSRKQLSPHARNLYSTVDEIDAATSRYHVITMFDFLEHVENPLDFLISLQKISHKNAAFIIGVPRMESLLARILGHRYWLFTPMHYSYFTLRSLEALLSKCFESVSIRKSPWESGPVNSALKWLGIDLKVLEDRSITVPHRSSYICICRKPILQES